MSRHKTSMSLFAQASDGEISFDGDQFTGVFRIAIGGTEVDMTIQWRPTKESQIPTTVQYRGREVTALVFNGHLPDGILPLLLGSELGDAEFLEGAAGNTDLIEGFTPNQPVTVSITSGSLPTGVTLSDGVLVYDGAGAAASSPSVTFRFTPTVGDHVDRTIAVTIADPGTVPGPLNDIEGDTVQSRVDDIEATTATMVWGSADGATGYRVLVGERIEGVNQQQFIDFISENLTEPVTGLTPNQEHWSRICPVNAAGQGPCAPRVNFTTPNFPSPPPEGTSLFAWDYSTEPLGPAEDIPDVWFRGGTGSGPKATMTIMDSPPLTTGGGRFIRYSIEKDGDQNFRVSRRIRHPSAWPLPVMDTVTAHGQDEHGNWHYKDDNVYFYRRNMRIVQNDDSLRAVIGGEWHEWDRNADGSSTNTVSGGSPVWALRVHNGTLRVTTDTRGPDQNFGNLNVNVGPEPSLNQVFKVEWHVRWDSRTSDLGSNGMALLYINDVLVFEWLNKSTCTRVLRFRTNGNGPHVPYVISNLYKAAYATSGNAGDKIVIDLDDIDFGIV
jgi:hypothetical protein